MSDLISRQAVENITWEEPSYTDPLNVLTEVREKVRALPSVENKGEWIVREDNTSFVKQIPRRWVECSHCGWSFSYDRIHDDFCSKCGADMRGKADEQT